MASNPKNTLNKYVEQLRSRDPNKRKQAIQWLAKSQNASAVKPLRWVYENDSDPEVKNLAGKAIRYIQKQTQTIPIVRSHPLLSTRELRAIKVEQDEDEDDRDDEEVIDDPFSKGYQSPSASSSKRQVSRPQVQKSFSATQEIAQIIEGYEQYSYQDPNSENYVSRADWEQSRTLMTNAYSDHVAGKDVSGLKKLGSALDLDPAVKDEEATKKAILALMSMPFEEGLAIMQDKHTREIYINRRIKQKAGMRINKGPLDMILDLLLFAVAQIVGLGLLLVVLQYQTNRLLAFLAADREYGAFVRINRVDPAATYRRIAEIFFEYRPVDLMIYAVYVGILIAVLMFLGNIVTFITARFILGGNGTFVETMTNLYQIPTVVMAIFYAVGVVITFLFYPMSATAVSGIFNKIVPIFSGVLVLIAVGFILFKQAQLTGIVHDIGIGKAVISIIMSLILIIGLGYVAYTNTTYFTL